MKRYHILDEIRGINLLSMILYHTTWDLVYIFGVDWNWFHTELAYIWQQLICWTFIILSGFCWSLGKHQLKRGLQVFGGGLIVSLVTEIFMPDERVRFGILTFLGAAMLLLIPLEKLVKNVSAKAGIIVCGVCFILFRGINDGYIGFENIFVLCKLPDSLYHLGDIVTFIGFTDTSFWSTDYFSLFPWFFLYMAGYFLYHALSESSWSNLQKKKSLGGFWSFWGKNSLLIYMIHQPIVYGVLMVLDKLQII